MKGRVLVTGGGGFLGSHVVERLRPTGIEPFVARGREHDLTTAADAARLFEEARPELVVHLAAEVGGIGANRAKPGRYWYANLMMGAHVLEQSRLRGVDEARPPRDDLRVPEARPGAVPRGRALGRLSGGDERAVRRREEGAARRRAGVPRAVRARTRSTCCRSTSTGRATTSTSRPRHVIPALIRKMVEAQERGEASRALGRRLADARVPLRRGLRRGDLLAAERYDGAEPVNLGTGEEISIRELAELIAELTGLRRRDRLGHDEAERPAAAQARHLARRGAVRLPCADAAARGLERTIAWYRRHAAAAAAMTRRLRRSHRPQGAALERARRPRARVESLPAGLRPRPRSSASQWLAVLALALTVRHNGWLYTRAATSSGTTRSWLLGARAAARPLVGYGWSRRLRRSPRVAGPNARRRAAGDRPLQRARPPARRRCSRLRHRRAHRRPAVRLPGAPRSGSPCPSSESSTRTGYHQKYTELTLPQALGLSAMSDFPSTVALLVAAYYFARALFDERPGSSTRSWAASAAGRRDRDQAGDGALSLRTCAGV